MAPELDLQTLPALIQRAEIEHLVQQIRAIRGLDPERYGGARMWFTSHGPVGMSSVLADSGEGVGGGAMSQGGILTIRSLPEFEGKLNRTIFLGGWTVNDVNASGGMEKAKEKEMETKDWTAMLYALERLYRKDGVAGGALEVAVSVWVPEFGSGFAGAEVGGLGEAESGELLECLRRGGYEATLGIEHFFYMVNGSVLRGGDGKGVGDDEENLPGKSIDGVVVTHLSLPAERASFPALSVRGFASGGRDPAFLRLLAEMAVQRPSTLLFQASISGDVAGVAGMAVFEELKVAYLYIDSTMPEFRGRGVHAVLLRERTRFAREMGCEVVLGSANRGSVSARSFVRNGFERGFGSMVFVKEVGGS